MFLHSFKYSFMDFIRNRIILFWIVLFPMLLGVMFNFAFGGIYDSTTKFSEIPAAVVTNGNFSILKNLLDEMDKSDTKLFKITYTDEETALSMLENGEVDGVIYDDFLEPKLSVRGESGITVSIIKTFLDRYKSSAAIIGETAMRNPAKIPEIVEAMSAETGDCLKMKNYSEGNMDPYVTYFYNLLGMACMYVSMVGMYTVIRNQANLSPQGMRINAAPGGKLSMILGSLAAGQLIFYIGTLFAAAFLCFVLGIDFGISFGWIAVIIFFGVAVGLTMGFFVGSIGRMSENTKRGLLLGASMLFSFLSGLMVGDMPMIIEESCPLLNRINPVRLICDSFYVMSSYGFNDRMTYNLCALAAWTVFFTAGGIIMSRRRKYKSL
ncbi:MAG: ABC transporter permease [Ruminiclostridium sp.]